MLRIDFYFSKLHLKTAHVEGRNIANLILCSASSNTSSSISLPPPEAALSTVSDDVYSSASTLHHRLYRTVAPVSYAHMAALRWTQMQEVEEEEDGDGREDVINNSDGPWKLPY